jgi:hypothetical protein
MVQEYTITREEVIHSGGIKDYRESYTVFHSGCYVGSKRARGCRWCLHPWRDGIAFTTAAISATAVAEDGADDGES